ncbi:hypothetical protein Fmac_025211 [Flemingia macrophylla]|uniref:Uncharacterized protein n=1 Tax=Flemingia macrophylla TaxID=520843 RepID=A0ABD1LRP0_9FABA
MNRNVYEFMNIFIDVKNGNGITRLIKKDTTWSQFKPIGFDPSFSRLSTSSNKSPFIVPLKQSTQGKSKDRNPVCAGEAFHAYSSEDFTVHNNATYKSDTSLSCNVNNNENQATPLLEVTISIE